MICDKIAYDSQGEASRQIPHLNRRHAKKHKYAVYHCEDCGKYHLTTTTKGNPRGKRPKYRPDYSTVIGLMKKGKKKK